MSAIDDLGLPSVRIPTVGEALEHRRNEGWTVVEFWRTDGDMVMTVRLMPDADETNSRWWRDQGRYVLPFRGTTQEPDRPVVVLVPAMETWNEHDPLREVLADFGQRGEEHRQVARMLSPKISAVVYGLVLRAKGIDVSRPNPWHVLLLPFNARRAMIESVKRMERTESPVDPVHGRDFILVRRKRDGYMDFSESGFSDEPRRISEKEAEWIRRHGWLDLGRVIGSPPTKDTVRRFPDILEACLSGEVFDPERWPGLRWREAYESEIAVLRAVTKLREGRRGSRVRAAADVPMPFERTESEDFAPTGGDIDPPDDEGRESVPVAEDADPLALLRRRIREGGER